MPELPTKLYTSHEPTPEEVQIISDVINELYRARAKFPSANHVTLAMVEEIGEFADELKKPHPDASATYTEGIQTVAMIIRNLTEFDGFREDMPTYLRLMSLSKAGEDARAQLNAVYNPGTAPEPTTEPKEAPAKSCRICGATIGEERGKFALYCSSRCYDQENPCG